MIQILTIPVGQMAANCYILTDMNTHEVMIVDPGDDAEFIAQTIKEKALGKPIRILATHGHFDHIMAATTLSLLYSVPFCVHKDDETLVSHMRENAQHFLQFDPGPVPHIDEYLRDKDRIRLGKESITVLHTPGHSPGSVCFFHEVQDSWVITGDLLFAHGAVGRTDFSYSNSRALQNSVKKILALKEKTSVYPGHGEATTIERERHFHLHS